MSENERNQCICKIVKIMRLQIDLEKRSNLANFVEKILLTEKYRETSYQCMDNLIDGQL